MRNDEIALLLATEVVIDARRHPELRGSLRGLARRGRLARVMPDVFADPAVGDDPRVRALAVCSAFPQAVIGGSMAARLSFAPQLAVAELMVYRSGGGTDRPGCRWWRGRPPPELVAESGGVRLTAPALTVLDLIPERGGDAVDDYLRAGLPLARLWEALALTAQRPGNPHRRSVLHESRDEPWSALERRGHALLRGAGITGWRTNHRIDLPARTGRTGAELPAVTYLGDVVWRTERLVVEFDGFTFHGDQEMFHGDRWRDARLHAEGWRVLRFTRRHLDDSPDQVLMLIRAALRARPVR